MVSIDPRLIVTDTAVKIFKQVLTKLVDTKWRTTEQANDILTQYKKSVSEMKEFYHKIIFGFKFGENRLVTFFYDVFNTKKTYADLWTMVNFLLTLSYSQAAVQRAFSINKEAFALNLKEDSLKTIHLVHDTILAEQTEIAEFVATDELLTSCSHASNRYKMYLMNKDKEAWEPKKTRKIKALQEELIAAKKRGKELGITAKK